MENIYLFMIIALFALAITDLVVGVSNDAVNFLNSAIGSKAISIRNIMIIASAGVAIGAIFSSGMMEVARKGIFTPDQFQFNEIMIIFMAVMLTDVLLLDVFNSLGLPTSTTVSIVFELLGAAVCIAILKIYGDNGQLSALSGYINTEKATEIILGILLSVVIAFSIGAIVQYISRMLLSFNFRKKLRWVGALFGGISLAAITYFILIKGLKGTALSSQSIYTVAQGDTSAILAWANEYFGASFASIDELFRAKKGLFSLTSTEGVQKLSMTLNGLLTLNLAAVTLINVLLWSLLSSLFIYVFKLDIYKIVIGIGTFALAMAFAGNDLVNFIGVPIAAFQSYELWLQSGVAPESFGMSGLSGAVRTPQLLLLLAGIIMVVTLWFSKKARTVVETGINLSRQDEGQEKFKPNFLSRAIVRSGISLNFAISSALPQKAKEVIENSFTREAIADAKEAPAFDLVRASVNLVVASILISIGTSLKLPLSTTYVTFMVAMGTSLADRAWGRESAVYRVAGVMNVIGGWFVTAAVAFTAASLFAGIIYFFGFPATVVLLITAFGLIIRSTLAHSKSYNKAQERSKRFKKEDIITIKEILNESSDNIIKVIHDVNDIYTKVINNLGLQELSKLKKNRKRLEGLEEELEVLKGNVFYFIRSLDDSSVEASKFYILILDYLQDMVQSISYIAKNTYSHVNNQHKNLKFNQIRDLKQVDAKMQILFDHIQQTFETQRFDDIDGIIQEKLELQEEVSALIQKQIERIRSTETSPKNTKLYFGLLLETKDLISATMNLMQLFKQFRDDAS